MKGDVIINIKLISQAVRFGITGVVATVIQYIVYILFINLIGINLAYSLGYGVSIIFNFISSNYYTFKTEPSKEKGIKFLLAHGINYLLQMGLLNIFTLIGIAGKLAPFLVYSISIPVNFFLVRKALGRGGK